MKQIVTLEENVFAGHWIIGLTFKPDKIKS